MDLGFLPLHWVRTLIRTKSSTQSLRDHILSLRAAHIRDREAARHLDSAPISPESLVAKLTRLQCTLRDLINSPLATPSQLLHGLSQACKADTEAIAFFFTDDGSKPAISDLVHQLVRHSFRNFAKACLLIGLATNSNAPTELARLQAAQNYALIVFRCLLTAVTKISIHLASIHNATEHFSNSLARTTALSQTLLASFYHAFFADFSQPRTTCGSSRYALHVNIQHRLLTRAADLLRATVLEGSTMPADAMPEDANQHNTDLITRTAAGLEARLLMPLTRTVMSDALRLIFPSSGSNPAHRSLNAGEDSNQEDDQMKCTRATLVRTLLERLYGTDTFAHLGPGLAVPPVVSVEDMERALQGLMDGIQAEEDGDEGAWFAGEIGGVLGDEYLGRVLWGDFKEGGDGSWLQI